MSIYVLDLVLVVGALSILFTTLQKNHRVHLRRGVCGAVAFALSFWLLSFLKDTVIGFISSLNLVQYLSFIPGKYLTENVKLAAGYAVILLAGTIVYLIILLIAKLFSNEGKKFRKDSSYAPIYRPFGSFLAGLFKVAVFAYLVCMFVFVCEGLFADVDLASGIIYPLVKDNGILVWAEDIKEVAQAILG